MHVVVILILLCVIITPAVAAGDVMRAENLRVEYHSELLGITAPVPRFSWQVRCERRGSAQTAWQMLVADAPEKIEADQGNPWDSGKVVSDDSILISYAGAPLQPRTDYWWRVRVWDESDTPSPWSDVARFSTGLPEADGWQAQWIGYDAPDSEDYDDALTAPLTRAHWIWHDEGNPREKAPRAKRLFRRTFPVPDDAVILHASLLIAADDAAKVWVNGQVIGSGQSEIKNWKHAHIFLVDGVLQPGRNVVAVEASNDQAAAGVVATLRVTLRDGTVMEYVTDDSWKTSTRLPGDDWKQRDFDDDAWKPAAVVAAFGEAPWEETRFEAARFKPIAHLRRTFTARKEIRRATLYATALGIYEMRLNGSRVGDLHFAPGWTNFRERVYYNTYDVSALLRPGGENVIGGLLALGWYAGHLSLHDPGVYGTRPRLMAQLEIEYADGTRDTIVTDEHWRVAHGEIRGADMQMGEIRDLRKVLTGWDAPGYDDTAWSVATTTAPEVIPKRIQPHPGAPVKQFENFVARSVSEPRPGVYVYDVGQNVVGWPRITVAGRAGQIIRVRQTEMLQDNDMPYTDALRRATATDIYHLAGPESVVLEPAFTFHGFRYVEIRGTDAPLPLESVVAVVLRSDVPITTTFECSEPLLNQLVSNITWGLKGNYLEIPTDCPQRDERLGWTGDAQFFMPTALYLADVGAFFTKWFVDLVQDAQHEDGSFAHVAPDLGWGSGATAWGDAAIICPWLFHLFYDDEQIIEQHFDNMVRGMAFLANKSKDYTTKDIGFGDWLNLGGDAKPEVIFTAYYAYLAQLMADMAATIGRDAEAAQYAALHQNIRTAFAEMFVDENGRIRDSSQTGYALAFAFDLIPESLRDAAARHFVAEIERFDNHLATGFIGTPRLLPALTLAGHDDVAWRLLMNTTYPSWLYQVTLGATTMWERWNGWTPETGFADVNMNSFNHYAFGAVGEWIFNQVAGISPTAPGFRTLSIHPKPGGGLTRATMTYQSVRGVIASAWRIENGVYYLNVTIPPGATALVHVATADPAAVRESGKPLQDMGITITATRKNMVVCEIPSGVYAFEAPAPETFF